jgi:HSP20 family molecular chaperone IbpA
MTVSSLTNATTRNNGSQTQIEETETTLIVRVTIPWVALKDLDIKIGDLSLLLSGENMERVFIEGYCDFSYPAVQFHKLIALSHPVCRDKFTVNLQGNKLTLILLKSTILPD